MDPNYKYLIENWNQDVFSIIENNVQSDNKEPYIFIFSQIYARENFLNFCKERGLP